MKRQHAGRAGSDGGDAAPEAASTQQVVSFRDDGVVALAAARALPVKSLSVTYLPLVVTVVGALIVAGSLLGLLAGSAGSRWAIPAGGICGIVVAALGARTGHEGRLDWLVPPLLKAMEYAFIATLGLASGAPPALVYVTVGVLAYHHYDLVYRARQRVAAPPRWLSRAGLGWDGRMLISALAWAAGVVTPVYVVLCAGLCTLFVGESVTSWVRFSARGAAGVELDE